MPPRINRPLTHSPERQRAWGTRYDNLVSPPPKEKTSSPTASPALSSGGGDAAAHSSTVAHDFFSRPTERRDWADDEVPLNTTIQSRVDSPTAGGTRMDHKQPHNASVFVASLPAEVDEKEVAQPLRDYLSEYAVVKEVKIIRDSKGGLCAFVQCESPAQAVQLVSQAQSNPRLFMGRHLRFENAKAHRTLWVSYRIPMQFVPCTSLEDEASDDVNMDANGVKGRWTKMDPPDVLRIWKPPQARYPIVSTRGEARRTMSRSPQNASPSLGKGQAYRLDGLFLPDLKCDAPTMKVVAEAFGPLEYFKTISSAAATKNPDSTPPGHRSNRSKDMDDAIWEVKWGHRDDCITAFNTMKGISHIAVSWAREAPTTMPRSEFSRSPISRNHLMIPSPLSPSSPASGRPLLLLEGKGSDASGQSSPQFDQSPSLTKNLSVGPIMRRDEVDDGWTLIRSDPRSHNITQVVLSSFADSNACNPALIGKAQQTPEWKDGDFPPLDSKFERITIKDETTEIQPPVQSPLTDASPDPLALVEKRSVSEAVEPAGATLPVTQIAEINAPVHRHRIVHRRSLSNPIGRYPEMEPAKQSSMHNTPTSQVLEVPPTPELANNTVNNTPLSNFEPQTPVYPHVSMEHSSVEHKISDPTTASIEEGPDRTDRDHYRRSTIDTKAIFVGGLETSGPSGWNEQKLRAVFSKYGHVLEVRLMAPSSKKTSFAFITFADEEGPIQAVRNEHNRTYGNRPIRVQMRDMYPPRGGFKARTRGTYRRPGFDSRIPLVSGLNHGQVQTLLPLNQGDRQMNAADDQVYNFASAHLHPTNLAPNLGNNAYYQHPQAQAGIEPFSHPTASVDMRSDRSTHRESDTSTSTSLTPPPNQHSPNASAFAPHSTPHPAHMGFFAPHGWTATYGPPFYPMGYGAFGNMPPPGNTHMLPSPQGNESSASPASSVSQWNPMSALPFAPYPYVIVPHTINTSASAQTPSPGKDISRPPLSATGFIQNEHGALIPVYPPQALGEYMNSTFQTQATQGAPGQSSTSAGGDLGQTMATHLPSQHPWPGYPAQFVTMPMAAPPAASQMSTSVHSQPPPPYAPNTTAMAPVTGLASSTSSSVSNGSQHGQPHQQQQQYPAHQHHQPSASASAQSNHPTHNHNPMSAHSSMGALTAAVSHQTLPKLTTSFSQSAVPQQRPDSFSFGRSGNGGNLRRSPSAIRINRPPQSVAGAIDDHQKFNPQNYSLPPRPNLPQLQTGFNRPYNEGHSQVHWMANQPHQQQ